MMLVSCHQKQPNSSLSCEQEMVITENNIHGFQDIIAALNCADQKDRPLFIEFALWGYSYPTFDRKIASNSTVQKYLTESFIPVRLMTDDKEELHDMLRYKSLLPEAWQDLKTVGDIAQALELQWCDSNAQPFYIILDKQGKKLTECWGHTSNPSVFIEKFKEVLAKVHSLSVDSQ